MEQNYIKSLKFSRKGNIAKGSDKIQFSLPIPGENTITVLCGRNRTGKSYILRVIKRCFETYNKGLDQGLTSKNIPDNDVQIEVTESATMINYFLISNVHDLLRYLKTISIEKETKFRERGPRAFRMHYDDPIKLKIALEKLAEDIIEFINPKSFDTDKWQESDSYRKEIIENTFEKNTCYRLNSKDDLVNSFFQAVGGHLYVGWNHVLPKTHLVLYLYYDEDRIISFENWSEGQKVLLLCLVISKYLSPDILVFDEIENHLHPEFISILLEYFKSRIRQTILSSHHPHIIFSKYVNSVWYLEIENVKTEYPEKITKPIKGTSGNLAPVRRCFELVKNYHKISKVYDLFDNFDNNLIRLSQSTLSDFNEYISDIFTNIYHYDIINSSPTKKVDIQVEGLLKHVIDKIDRLGNINVLEIGPGKGRVLLDIAKVNSSNISSKVNWTLYEPVMSVYSALEHNINDLLKNKELHYNIDLTNSLNFAKKFDIIFFANVIHELTPNILTSYFSKMPNLLNENGEVIIIEIFPLLLPEYFSVPYKRFEIEKLFRQLNWSVSSDSINIKNSKVDAYWSVLRKKFDTLTGEDQITSIIENFWTNEVLPNRCADYGGRAEFKSAEESITLMSELTTIASIASYNNKEWRLSAL